MPVTDYDPIVEAAAREWNVDPHWVRAIMQRESAGQKMDAQGRPIRSSAGAGGLMQLMPGTARDLGVEDVDNVVQNIYGGAKYLSQMLDKFGNPVYATAAYNAGPQRVQDWLDGKAPLPAETQGFVPNVASAYQKFKGVSSQASKAAAKTSSDEMSDDDFLKSVGAVPSAPVATSSAPPKATQTPTISPKPTAEMSDDDFLKSVGAAPEAPAKPATQAAELPATPPGLNQSMRPQAMDVQPVVDAAGRIGNAVAEGWNTPNPLMSDKLRGMIERAGPVGYYITSPLLQAGGAVLRGANALGSGLMATVGEGAALAGAPELGRDLNMMSQVAPMAGVGYGPLSAAKIEPAAPTPKLVSEHFAPAPEPGMTRGDRLMQLIQHDENEINGRPAQTQSFGPKFVAAEDVPSNVPALTDEGARPVGAQVSTAAEANTPKTPGQAAADLRKSVTQTAAERAGPQGVDNEEYVPGVKRTLAARQFSPENSVAEKVLRETDQAYDAQFRALEKENNDTMVDYYNQHAGDAIALEKAQEARRELSPDNMGVFTDQKPVDFSPLAQDIQKTLQGPAGKQRAVENTLKGVLERMYDSDGNLETMPDMMYGVRKHITDLLDSSVTTKEGSEARAARAQLTGLLDKLDPLIEEGAPKFGEYRAAYSAASKPIDQMKFLQDQLVGAGKITDANGRLRFAQVQKLLDKIDKDRRATGNNAAKSLTDEQINAIVGIRNELAALEYRDYLAKTKGSDTTQKLNKAGGLMSGPIGMAVKAVADKGAHALLAGTVGPAGNAAYEWGVKPVARSITAARQAARTDALKQQLLQTSPLQSQPPSP